MIGSIRALMNNPPGRAHVIEHSDAIETITLSLAVENVKTKLAVLEILGPLCLVPGGHKRVLTALTSFATYAGERTRFQGIMLDLARSRRENEFEVELKTQIMALINALLKFGAGAETLEFRLHLRFEFLMLGIIPLIEKLKQYENHNLNRHLEVFILQRERDENVLREQMKDKVRINPWKNSPV